MRFAVQNAVCSTDCGLQCRMRFAVKTVVCSTECFHKQQITVNLHCTTKLLTLHIKSICRWQFNHTILTFKDPLERRLPALSPIPPDFKFSDLQMLSIWTSIKFCHLVNPFPNKPWFLRVCSTSLLKTLREKEKLLVTSNFSFSHSVFYLFGGLSAIFNKLEIVVCKLFQFRRV